jgi:hypothetical protein
MGGVKIIRATALKTLIPYDTRNYRMYTILIIIHNSLLYNELQNLWLEFLTLKSH